MRSALGALMLMLVSWGFSAEAATCRKTSTVCTDASASKLIGQTTVPVAAIGGCWNYLDSYECDTDDSKDYCQPVIALGCGSINSVCNSTSTISGKCLNYMNTFVCTNKEVGLPLPTNVWLMDTRYRIASEVIDDSACAGLAAKATCTLYGGDVCTDATPSKVINGLSVARACWSWDRTYQCVDSKTTTDCGPVKTNPACKETASSCTEMMGAVCQVIEHQYTCTNGGAGPTVTSSCAADKFCMGTVCFDTGYPADQGFGQVVVGMELMRQAGYYLDPNSLEVFKGTSEKCEKKLFGLGDCCKTSGGGSGYSNDNVASTLGLKGLQFGGEYVKAVGTPYVYDMLWNSGSAYLSGIAETAWSASAWTSTGNVGLYGFTWSVGAEAITFVGFDPWSFAASVALQVAMSMLSCNQDEQALAMKRGQNLCIYTGDRCTEKFLGACLTREQKYCCYNSVLGKIVARGAGAQLGRPPSGGNCGGFSPAELQTVNFAAIDFSEFIAQVAPTVKTVTPAAVRATSNISAGKINSYYGK